MAEFSERNMFLNYNILNLKILLNVLKLCNCLKFN